MKFLAPAISKIARMRIWRIKNWRNHPVAAQRDVLQDLVTTAQYTDFGKAHHFSNLYSLKAFKANVPIQEYENTAPFIEKMMNGEENILWNTPVKWFAKSSGTTSSKSKFIPVSEESLQENHFKASKDVLANYYNNFPSSDLLTGKGLVVGGSHQLNQVNEDIQYGDLSAVLMQNTPFWGQWLRTPELSVALLDNWTDKIEKLATATADENVTSLAGVPTWTLLLLKRILEIKGKNHIKEVWPNLELYIHGGVSFIPYREQFEKIMGAPINYLEIYNASEGFFAGQENPNDDGMTLFTEHGIFYEFMPVEEYGKSTPLTVGLDKVKQNQNYALIISTAGGLWRYLVGDTVSFTSINPYRIKVTGRLKHYINAFGEELIVENSDRAIAIAAQITNSRVLDYTAAPIFFSETHNGAHEWLIEFEQPPISLNKFTIELDNALKSLNSDYEAKRSGNIALELPKIQILPNGIFNKWLLSKNKLGGQHKIPRLCNDRKILEEILTMI
ncbi:MAG: GH3 auxin-responsive promoter family protein [Sphingobacteriales bacterium]|nr:GH3 auxin-responsive promoter family protein [Sphingobacteriales bacterium]